MKIFLIEHFRAVRRAKQPARRLSEVGFYEGYFMQESPLKKANKTKKRLIVSEFKDYTEEDYKRDIAKKLVRAQNIKTTWGEKIARFIDRIIQNSKK